MPINVPQSVFDKYYDVIDSTFTIFGVTCKLVYIETVEEISTSYDNLPTHNSISAHRRGGGNPAYRREEVVLKEVEKTEDIKLKVYWDNRAWIKVSNDIVVPDNSIQTISYSKIPALSSPNLIIFFLSSLSNGFSEVPFS